MLLTSTLKAATGRFPLPLVCHRCSSPLETEPGCSCPDRLRLGWFHGLPRTLFGQNHRSEISREKMLAILALTADRHWQEALKEVAGNESVYRHLTAQVGADFIYGISWDEIDTALDIGAGMGFLTMPMAAFAKRVVAVEAVPERAQFIARRAEQDGFDNVFPIIADGTDLPFKAQSFDLIALHGVLEDVGLWSQGDPLALQRSLLERVFRLLRPGGYLSIGIKQRYAFYSWLGARDRSGLRFTSLMPRFLANLSCKLLNGPMCGSKDAPRGYRTYTHSPRVYEHLLRQAGFQAVEIHGAFGGYHRQLGIYPLANYEACRAMRHIVNPASSFFGSLQGKLGNFRPLHQMLEDEILIFARKQIGNGRITWSFLDAPGTVAQFSTSDKALAVSFTEGKPTTIYKTTKIGSSIELTEHEYRFLLKAEDRLGCEAKDLPIRWTKPLGRLEANGRAHYRYEFVQGQSLATLLLPWRFRRGRLKKVLAQLSHGYVALCERMSARMLAPEHSAQEGREQLSAALEEAGIEDRLTRQHLRAACSRLRRSSWRPGVIHGDLAVGNAVLRADGKIVLVDWENASESGLVAIDLVRLLYDTWVDSRILSRRVRDVVMADTRETIRQTLFGIGLREEDFADLEVLFVAHQCRLMLSRHGDVDRVLRAHRDRAFSLRGVECS
jgi:SAM-dependent methyltransferase